MKEFVYDYKDGLIKGLRPYKDAGSENHALSLSLGLYPDNTGVLKTPLLPSRLNLDFLGCSFPYPQVFITSALVIVCTQDSIYEGSVSMLHGYVIDSANNRTTGSGGEQLTYQEGVVMKLCNLTVGELWTFADFQSYILLSNGRQNVIRDKDTSLYSVTSLLPKNSCLCNTEGQVIMGSINVQQTVLNIDQTGFTNFNSTITGTGQLTGTGETT